MPWCPRCREEYREGFKVCGECNTELVDRLEPSAGDREEGEPEEWTFLMNVADGPEVDIVESLLNSNGLPTMRKHKGAGDFTKIYMGISNFGIDLYVPKSRLEEANEIIAAKPEEIPIPQTAQEEEFGGNEKIRGERARLIILIFFILPGLLGLLFSIFHADNISLEMFFCYF